MGILSRALALPTLAKTLSTGVAIPTWDSGRAQDHPFSYERGAREGYMLDELVYACMEFRMDCTAEAPMCAFRSGPTGKVKVDDYEHPALNLLARPNPHMSQSRIWKTTSMHLDIDGNAYWHKVRSAAGRVVELWPLRPDRVKIIPDARTFVGAYQYTIGDKAYTLSADDIIHFRTENPVSDYYGLSRLHVLSGRIDLDVWQREFTSAFFRNAGVPFGLLNIQRSVQPDERNMIRQQFRADFGGSQAFSVGVVDGGTATYTAMGLPFGDTGIAMPTLDEINEARICAVFAVQPSLISTRLGLRSSSYANRVSDRDLFWDQVQVPRINELDAALTLGLQPDFPDISMFEHDLTDVRALQPDEDKLHARTREDFVVGLIQWERAMIELGYDPSQPGVVLVPNNVTATWSEDMLNKPAPEPAALPGASPPKQPATNGHTNGVAT